MRPRFLRDWPSLLAAGVALLAASPASGQDLSGVVRDARSGAAIEDVLVQADPAGRRALTGVDGSFRLVRMPEGLQTLTFSKYGYADTVVEVSVPLDDPLDIRLEVQPIELEGLEAVVPSFERRLTEVERTMDVRYHKVLGDVTVMGPAQLRPYDERHQKDPWVFMIREMRVDPQLEEEGVVRVRGFHAISGRYQRPEVYLDGRRVHLFEFVREPLASICRMEYFTPMPHDISYDPPPPQLRAYTCSYMIQVANGERELPETLQWGSLLSGGGGP